MTNFSVSKLKTLFTCPYRYYLKYIAEDRPVEKDTLARILGIAIHETIEQDKGYSVEELQSSFRRRLLDAISSSDLMVKRGDNITSLLNRGLKMVSTYHALISQIGGYQTKKEWWLKFPYHEFQLTGRIDWLSKIGVYDFKTGRYDPPQDVLPHDLQFAVYRLGFLHQFNEEPKLYWVSLESGKIYPVELSNEFTKEPGMVLHLLNYAADLIDWCQEWDHFPATPKYDGGFACNNCGYRHVCFS